jgi:outer membrane immunogenic protein
LAGRYSQDYVFIESFADMTDTRYEAVAAATGAVTLSSGYSTNWSAAVAYDHIFQTGRDLRFHPAGVVLADTFRSGGDTDMITARLNYRFGGPVVARC